MENFSDIKKFILFLLGVVVVVVVVVVVMVNVMHQLAFHHPHQNRPAVCVHFMDELNGILIKSALLYPIKIKLLFCCIL